MMRLVLEAGRHNLRFVFLKYYSAELFYLSKREMHPDAESDISVVSHNQCRLHG